MADQTWATEIHAYSGTIPFDELPVTQIFVCVVVRAIEWAKFELPQMRIRRDAHRMTVG